jgi:hypothetical protein
MQFAIAQRKLPKMNDYRVLTKELVQQYVNEHQSNWEPGLAILDFDGFDLITDEAARAVSEIPVIGRYSEPAPFKIVKFNDLKWISDEGFYHLTNTQAGLCLNSLTSMSLTSMTYLREFSGAFLQLNGLLDISDQSAKCFSFGKSHGVQLNGLKHVSEALADALSHCSQLYLSGLHFVERTTLLKLLSRHGEVFFAGLRRMPEQTVFSRTVVHRSRLNLPSLRTVTDGQACFLGGLSCDLQLDAIVSLSLAQAQSLCADGVVPPPKLRTDEHWLLYRQLESRKVSLLGLTEISDDIFSVFLRYPGPICLSESCRTIERESAERASASWRHSEKIRFAEVKLENCPWPGNVLTKQVADAFIDGGLEFSELRAIELITTEGIRQLAEGIRQLAEVDHDEGFAATSMVFDFSSVKSLNSECAALLAKMPGSIILSGIQHLPGAVAAELRSSRAYSFCFDGLREVDEELAASLSRFESRLPRTWLMNIQLNGVSQLSPEVAGRLSSFRGRLYLNGLSKCPPKEFFPHAIHLVMNGISQINRDEAADLISGRGNLSLDGLTLLSDETAELLAERDGDLSLCGLRTLSENAAAAFGMLHNKSLILNGVGELSPEVALALGKHTGRVLALNGVSDLSAEAANGLALHKGSIELNGLRFLNRDVTYALLGPGAESSRLELRGVESISSEILEGFSSFFKASVDLRGLREIDKTVAEIFAKSNASFTLDQKITGSTSALAVLKRSSNVYFVSK